MPSVLGYTDLASTLISLMQEGRTTAAVSPVPTISDEQWAVVVDDIAELSVYLDPERWTGGGQLGDDAARAKIRTLAALLPAQSERDTAAALVALIGNSRAQDVALLLEVVRPRGAELPIGTLRTILTRIAAGSSARAIAVDLGVDRKTIARLDARFGTSAARAARTAAEREQLLDDLCDHLAAGGSARAFARARNLPSSSVDRLVAELRAEP